MVVRNSWSVVACLCAAGALGCGGKSDPAATTVPVVTSFSPAKGFVNSTVTVTGSGFDGTTSVSLGGATASFTRKSDTELTVTVPTSAQTGIIGVVNAKGSGASTASFNVTPQVLSFSPISASPNQVVTINGNGLAGIKKVNFGTGPDAFFLVNSANQVQAVVPLGSSTGPITITAANNDTATSGTFTYTGGNVTAPVLTSFAPVQARTSEYVTLTGSGFNGVTTVRIGGVAAFMTLVNDTTLSVQVPSAAVSGFISLESVLGNASSTTPFLVVPTLTDFSPAQGAAGALVSLRGTGFVGTSSVSFGGSQLSNFVVQNANLAYANVAAGSGTGPVTLVSNGLTATSPQSFTFLADATQAPVITALSAASALAGDTVTLTGTGFTGVTSVQVGGVAATFEVNSDTSITLTVPAAAQTGVISVTNAKGTYGFTSMFTVLPAITNLAPSAGAVGTTVSLTGSGFAGATAVAFGGVNANFVVVDANHITTQVPTGAVTGAVTVTASGQTATSATFTVQ